MKSSSAEVRLAVAGVQRRPRAVAKQLARQEVRLVGLTGNVDDVVLVFGKQVEPARLVVADVALLLQPQQTRVVSTTSFQLIPKRSNLGGPACFY